MCGYRKGFSTQQALLSLIENWKNTLDQNGNCSAMRIFRRLFDSFSHDLLIAKLGRYGFDTRYVKLITCYLTNRLQRTKVNKSFSSCTKLLLREP